MPLPEEKRALTEGQNRDFRLSDYLLRTIAQDLRLKSPLFGKYLLWRLFFSISPSLSVNRHESAQIDLCGHISLERAAELENSLDLLPFFAVLPRKTQK